MFIMVRKFIGRLRGTLDIDKLIKRGLQIGENVSINGECAIDESFCWLIHLGSRVTLGPRVHILAHDASAKRAIGYTKLGLVEVGDDVFIGAGSILLPGAKIGSRVVIGAGSVVTGVIPDNSVAVGVPARVVSAYDEYIARCRTRLDHMPVYDRSFTVAGGVTEAKKEQMRRELARSGGGFVR